MRALLSTVLGGLLLAGCGQETSAPPAPAPSTVAERSQGPAVVGPILVTFSENGAGEINGETLLTTRSIAAVFPDASVETALYEEAGVEIITVRRPDGLVLDLHPGADPKRVGEIIGRAGPVTGPLGEKLGADWATMGFEPADCRRGQDDMSHTLICYRPGEPLLGYVFDLSAFEGPDDQIPEPDVLEAIARLNAFVWTAAPT
jgi:hypothetical protein